MFSLELCDPKHSFRCYLNFSFIRYRLSYGETVAELTFSCKCVIFTPQFACLCFPAVRALDPWSYGLRFLFTSLKWFFGSRDALQITCFTSYPLLRFDLSRVEIVSKERSDKIIEKGLMCQNIGPFSFIGQLIFYSFKSHFLFYVPF